jgi:sugar lactone lactonase YvrE
LRTLFDGLTIPNACCFAPDGSHAHFCDTARQIVMKVALDHEGWPRADPRPWLDLRAENLRPDGAVIDAAGNFWCALYGAAQVAAFDPAGRRIRTVKIPAAQATCPAFGGPDLTTLLCTSAWQRLSDSDRAANPDHGRTFAVPQVAQGLPEHRVLL